MGSKAPIGVSIVLAGALALSATSALAHSACCKPDGSCRIEETQEICESFDGVWNFGKTCDQVECDKPTTTTIKVTTTTIKVTTTTVKVTTG
jgi:hypothetical protein